MITAQAHALRDAVAWLNRHTPKRPPHPIMGAHVLTFDGSTLTLAVYDYETAAQVRVDADGQPLDAPLLVNGATFAAIIARLEGTITLTPDATRLQVTTGRHRFHLTTMPGDEYPPVPPPVDTTGTADAALLSDAVTRAATCLGRAQNEPTLMNYQIEATDTELVIYATDRYRLARCTARWDGEAFTALVPGSTLANAVRDMRGTVTLGVDDNRLTVADATRHVTVSRSGADPKALSRIMESATAADEVTLERDDALDAIRAAQAVLRDGPNVTFTFADASLTVAATDDAADSATVLDVNDPDLTATAIFAAEYIESLIDAAPGDHITLGLPAAGNDGLVLKPVLVWGGTGDDTDTNHTFLLVPLRKVN